MGATRIQAVEKQHVEYVNVSFQQLDSDTLLPVEGWNENVTSLSNETDGLIDDGTNRRSTC